MSPANIFPQIILTQSPYATAFIRGNKENPNLNGKANLYSTPFGGTLLEISLLGLPHNDTDFFAFHIHESGDCTPPFSNTGNHYNPQNMPHPLHAGDFPPLLSNEGFAYNVVFTQRFTPAEVLEHSIIIHNDPDNFTTQPSGNSGAKIACGTIINVSPYT